MAVAKMLKLELISHDANRRDLLTDLQQCGVLEITQVKETEKEEMEEVVSREEAGELHLLLSRINFCLDLLNRFEQKKKGLIASMIPDKPVIGHHTYEAIEKKLPFDSLYQECEKLEIALRKNEACLNESQKKLKELEPWSKLNIPLGVKETANTVIKKGEIHNSMMEPLLEEIEKKGLLANLEVVKELGVINYVSVIIHNQDSEEALNLLSEYDLREMPLSGYEGFVNEVIDSINKEIECLEVEKNNLTQRGQDMLFNKHELVIAHDYVNNLLEKAEVQQTFKESANCFLISGWIAKNDTGKLTEILQKYETVDIKINEPDLEDTPPVKLINKGWLKPFEVVTTMYGTPRYDEVDPTPFLAPFFIVFFGLALGDVGYGVVLAIGSLFIRSKLNLSEKTVNFFKLFMYGGFASIIAGVITGSYFAIDGQYLPHILKRLAIFDPLNQPVPFLILALMLGLIQVTAGTLIELYDNIRNHKAMDGILDNIPVTCIIAGGALMIWWMFKWSAGEAPPWWSSYAIWLSIGGTAGVVAFSNRQSKSIAGKIGGGLYNLYGMTSLLGDVVSYARLMALGLATFVVGWSFNLMAGLIFQSSVVAGSLFFIVLIFLHFFNLMINLIAAFVHPARLQYVEFFGKFFEGGGKKFEPFSIKTEKLYLK